MTYLPTTPTGGAGGPAGALTGADQVSVTQSGVARLTTLATLKTFVLGGAAPIVPVAASASAIVGVPTSGIVSGTLAGMTVTLSPTGSTAYAVLSTGASDIGTRIAFS